MTTKMLAELERLHGEGLIDREIAEEIGVGIHIVQYWRTKEGLKPNRLSTRYTVYDRRTSAFIVEGTSEVCSAFLGIKRKSFISNACRFWKGQDGKYEIYKVDQ